MTTKNYETFKELKHGSWFRLSNMIDTRYLKLEKELLNDYGMRINTVSEYGKPEFVEPDTICYRTWKVPKETDADKELEDKAKKWDLLVSSVVDIIDDVHKSEFEEPVPWGNLQNLIK